MIFDILIYILFAPIAILFVILLVVSLRDFFSSVNDFVNYINNTFE